MSCFQACYYKTECMKYVLCSMVGVFVTVSCSPFAFAVEDAPVYALVRESLVIITAGKSSGSGFICQMNGKKYLITNDHVLRSGQPFSASLLDGKKLSFLSLEVAGDRDLVRLEIADPTLKGLAVSTKTYNLYDPVFVFGNSDGGGVATSLSGKILGVGPVFVETDATFVPGNSGSPIVDSQGEVVAVATFAIRDRNPGDWVKQGSRFTDVRRFGVKMETDRWELIEAKEYFIRAGALADIETFCLDLYKLRFTSVYREPVKGRYIYFYNNEQRRYTKVPNLCKILSDAVVSFNYAVDAKEEAERRVQYAARDRSSIGAAPMASMGIMTARQAEEKYKAAYKKVYFSSLRLLTNNNWITTRLKQDASFWLEVVKVITDTEGD